MVNFTVHFFLCWTDDCCFTRIVYAMGIVCRLLLCEYLKVSVPLLWPWPVCCRLAELQEYDWVWEVEKAVWGRETQKNSGRCCSLEKHTENILRQFLVHLCPFVVGVLCVRKLPVGCYTANVDSSQICTVSYTTPFTYKTVWKLQPFLPVTIFNFRLNCRKKQASSSLLRHI